MKTWLVLAVAFLPSVVWASDFILPEDQVYAPALIHHLEHQIEGKNELDVNYSYLYGDKFLSSQGVMIEDSYHFSENWAVGLGFGYYKSGTTSEFENLSAHGSTPYVYDPSWLAKAVGIYDPIYGKILIGSQIVHFRIETEAGVHLAKLTSVDSGITNDTFTRLGPLLGASARVYVWKRLTVGLGTDFLVEKSAEGDQSSSMRKIWLFNMGVGMDF